MALREPLENLPHKPGSQHLHCSQHAYLPSSHRTAHWALNTNDFFQPKVLNTPAILSKTRGQICRSKIFPLAINFCLNCSFYCCDKTLVAKESWREKCISLAPIAAHCQGKSRQKLEVAIRRQTLKQRPLKNAAYWLARHGFPMPKSMPGIRSENTRCFCV